LLLSSALSASHCSRHNSVYYLLLLTPISCSAPPFHSPIELPSLILQLSLSSSRRYSFPTLPIEWVNRLQVNTEIQNIFHRIISSFRSKSRKPNEYNFIVIPGPSGDGKTRTGQHIPILLSSICRDYNIPAVVICAFFQPALSPLSLPFPPGYSELLKPPRIPMDVQQGGKVLSLAVASWYFCNEKFSTEIQQHLMGLSSSFIDFTCVVAAIRNHQQMSKDQIMVLTVQLDEFQNDSYTTLCVLRYISDLISNGFFMVRYTTNHFVFPFQILC
jgi:hypothetical protein